MSRNAVGLLVVTGLLMASGVLMLFSASAVVAAEGGKFHDPYFFLKKQLVWIGISLVGFLIFSRIDYRFWMKWRYAILAATLGMLVAVLVPGIGSHVNGARRWIRLGSIGIQPSEFAKLAMIVFFAAWLAQDPGRIAAWKRGVLPALGFLAVVAGLIACEPDIGTAMFTVGIISLLLLAGGMRVKHSIMLGAFVAAMAGLVLLTAPDYVHKRINDFLTGKGYHITQSLIALGSGGLTGVGLGESTQKLFYLPEVQGDFIFAIIGEELGFIGTVGFIGLFMAFLWMGWRIARAASTPFGFLTAMGVTVWITLQAATNMAVVTASVPAKGLSLPFISFGGSSLFFLLCGVGLMFNIANQKPIPQCVPEPVRQPETATAQA